MASRGLARPRASHAPPTGNGAAVGGGDYEERPPPPLTRSRVRAERRFGGKEKGEFGLLCHEQMTQNIQ